MFFLRKEMKQGFSLSWPNQMLLWITIVVLENNYCETNLAHSVFWSGLESAVEPPLLVVDNNSFS